MSEEQKEAKCEGNVMAGKVPITDEFGDRLVSSCRAGFLKVGMCPNYQTALL